MSAINLAAAAQVGRAAADRPTVPSALPAQLIEMPGWRPIMRQVLTRVTLVSLLPMAVFYVTFSLAGVRAAAVVTASCYYLALFSRIIRRKPILAAALLAAGL